MNDRRAVACLSLALLAAAATIGPSAAAEPAQGRRQSPVASRERAARAAGADNAERVEPEPAPVAPALRRFAGEYRLASDPEDGRREVRRAFLEAIEQVPNFLRPTLRRQMDRRDWLVESVAIAVDNGRISTRAKSYRTFSWSSVPDEIRIYTSKEGNETHVLQRLHDGRLEITLQNRRGRMHNVLTLHDAGRRVHVAATFSSPLLDRPISLALSYERVEPPRRDRPDRRGPRRNAPRNRPERGPRPPAAAGAGAAGRLRQVRPLPAVRVAPRVVPRPVDPRGPANDAPTAPAPARDSE